MGDKRVFRGKLTEAEVERREIFLATYFKDGCDSFKQLFTLNSAVLLFFSTFAKDKLFTVASQVPSVASAKVVYGCLAVSLLFCIVGIYLLQMAGEKATNLNLWGYRLSLGKYSDYAGYALVANWLLEGAGILFIVGILVIGSVLL